MNYCYKQSANLPIKIIKILKLNFEKKFIIKQKYKIKIITLSLTVKLHIYLKIYILNHRVNLKNKNYI